MPVYDLEHTPEVGTTPDHFSSILRERKPAKERLGKLHLNVCGRNERDNMVKTVVPASGSIQWNKLDMISVAAGKTKQRTTMSAVTPAVIGIRSVVSLTVEHSWGGSAADMIDAGKRQAVELASQF
jgi:hypothetical protein